MAKYHIEEEETVFNLSRINEKLASKLNKVKALLKKRVDPAKILKEMEGEL